MYSDEWMRQNQFLGKSARVGDILQSKRRKLPELLSVEMTSTVRDAITTMNRFGVSQLPGIRQGESRRVAVRERALPKIDGELPR